MIVINIFKAMNSFMDLYVLSGVAKVNLFKGMFRGIKLQ